MQRRNILLVEDDHRERVQQCQEIEALGYHVITAYDSMDANKKLKLHEIGLVIVEYELSGEGGGIDLLKRAKSENEDLEVLYISKSPSVENAVEAMKAGALDFIVKPVDRTQMRLCIEKALNKNGDKTLSQQKKRESTAIVTQNEDMLNLIKLADKVADSTASVFVHGESGTGKELFARYIHENSNRRSGPFVAVNCAALPESLLESELFGHEKGAFTGAISKKPGKFEIADGGTILLDEVTEMAYHLQSKLLRIIQEREVDRVGGLRPVKVDVRIIATSNRDIKRSIEKGEFREDLYYRLNTIPLRIPPLRERVDDIGILAQHFIKKYNEIDGRNVKSLTKNALDLLCRLSLKGNVRELENLVQRAVLLSDGESIKRENLFLDGAEEGSYQEGGNNFSENNGTSKDILASPLREVEKKMIFHTLDKTKGNRTHAAKILGISVRTLRNKLNEYKEKIEKI